MEEDNDEFTIPEDVAEWIELKKSQLLSELILAMKHDDYGFEDFPRFDPLVNGTIEKPDKAYQRTEDDYVLRTYVKSYKNPEYFHQVVIGVLFPDKETQVFVPILIFVSRDQTLVRSFEKGEVLVSHTLN